MQLYLVKPSSDLEQAYENFRTDWKQRQEKIVPFAVRGDGLTYPQLLQTLHRRETAPEEGQVPATVFFLINEKQEILGAIDIRHRLNDYLLSYGGHIGYGVRPSYRGRGLAAKMLSMALPYVKKLGIDRALITCDKENPASAQTILRCGGVLEDERFLEGEWVQRYWIELPC